MSAADFIYKILSKEKFILIRNWYYSALRIIYKPLTEEKFRNILENKLGVSNGKVVFVHSSIEKMNLGFPFYKVLSILLDIVGPEGTLLFPAWQYQGRAEDYTDKNSGKIFDVNKTPTAMGLLPEMARRHKMAQRSSHPTSSIVAIGAHAKELVSGHHLSIFPCGELSPYYKMLDYDSIIIGLGEKTVSLSFVHCVEDILKEEFPVKTLQDKPYECMVLDHNCNKIEVKTLIPHKNIQIRRIPLFMTKYISKNICKTIKYRGCNYFTADAKKLYNRMLDLAKDNITIYS
jgi:aminoglycoside N3'-acetyltransferase